MATNPKTMAAKESKETIRISGAEAVIKCLLAEGVDLVYGYPGGAIMPVYDEFFKFQDKICLLYTSPSPRDGLLSRMPSSA